MTATAHALVGGAIAASSLNPIYAVPFSFLSHPILDFIPHWDLGWGWRKKSKKRLFLESTGDLLLGCILSFFLFGQHLNLWYFWSCIFASLALDLFTAPYLVLDWHFPPFNWIYRLQSKIQGKASYPLGIATQVISVVLIIFILTKFSEF